MKIYMQKTYWWRITVFLIAVFGLAVGYVIFYPYVYGMCVSSEGHCVLSSYKKTFAEPLFLISLALLAISPFLFFVRDTVFLKWLRFAIVWFVITVLLIALAPVSTGGWMSFGPTKEFVSIWMGALFVIASLAKLVWDSKKA